MLFYVLFHFPHLKLAKKNICSGLGIRTSEQHMFSHCGDIICLKGRDFSAKIYCSCPPLQVVCNFRYFSRHLSSPTTSVLRTHVWGGVYSTLCYLWDAISLTALGWRSLYSDSLPTGMSGDRIPVRTRLPDPSRPALGPNQPPVPRVPGIFPRVKAAGAWR